MSTCNHHTHKHENNTKIVTIISFATMIMEVVFGYYTKSMALLADGWHMATHVFAIGLAWVAYKISNKLKENSNFKNGTGKFLTLSGYTSAIVLLLIAFAIAYESVLEFINPKSIEYREAIFAAIIGFIVNGISAFILHHDHAHSDYNIKAAYFHVMADMITSVAAIFALCAGWWWNLFFLDAVCGVIGAFVIAVWAIGLIKESGKELLDYSLKSNEIHV